MKKIIIPIIVLLLIVVAVLVISTKKEEKKEEVPSIKTVTAINLATFQPDINIIKAIGIVKPNSKVDVISLGKGTVKTINIQKGSYVNKGSVLVVLNNESVKESLEIAKTVQKSAKDNLDNAETLFQTSSNNQKESAIITARGYLNTIFDLLKDINFIIKAEGTKQLPGIATTLSAQNSQDLIDAKNTYFKTKEKYNETSKLELTKQSITSDLGIIIETQEQTEKALNNLIKVLNNTLSNANFSQSSLDAQKTIFTALRSALLLQQSQAGTQFQTLSNLDVYNKAETDALNNALNLSNNQLNLAQIAFDNLTITATIQGQITEKLIELGTEVNPGQKVSEISQNNLVKVEVSLTPNEVRNISQKQNVKIEGNISGVINVISPIANFQSKKIEIEIIVNNSDKRLTPETFVTVEIPTQNQPSNLVPLKALIVTQNESYVFVVENNKAIKKIVITKETQGSFIEVTGLLMTEILIVNGARDLENLEEIKVEYDN